MPRCKMDKPERADYLRVFCAVMLTDEDWETLDRAKFGSACLLMFHAWAKKGTLPNDPEKLAALARCTVEELEALKKAWPKLVPLEDLEPDAEPGRVTIPYLWNEWKQVMGFYQDQKWRSDQAVAARKAKEAAARAQENKPMGAPMDEPMGQPEGAPFGTTLLSQSQSLSQSLSQKDKTTCAAPGKPDPAPDTSPVALLLPCVGKGPKEWPVTENTLASWKEAFPGVDPLAEARKMRLWLDSQPARRKTYAGMARFALGWLGRAQDSAKPTSSQGAPNGRPANHRSQTDDAYRQHLLQAHTPGLPDLQ